MKIYCIACQKEVDARLTNGIEIYPHRPDLAEKSFWKCDVCKNYVGCHVGKTHIPFGCIATPEIFKLRQQIHSVINPIWKSGKLRRATIYAKLSKILGREYHTGNIRSVDECYLILKEIRSW